MILRCVYVETLNLVTPAGLGEECLEDVDLEPIYHKWLV